MFESFDYGALFFFMNYKISTEENARPYRVIVFIEFYNSEFNYHIVLAGFPV